MRKILMRAWMNPLEAVDSAKVIANNMIGNNLGNLLFPHSIARTLMCEDVVIETMTTNHSFTDEEAERINSEYESFIIPLANAFRDSFLNELADISNLVNRLTIPCVVVGVGVQAKMTDNIHDEFSFDNETKRFIKEILNKSAMIGVRGEITAEYMKKLGFVEEKDFTVIGCPTMYMHGDQLPLKTPAGLNKDSLVSVNRKIGLSAKSHNFIVRSSRKFDNYMYVPQGIEDLTLLYTGKPISLEQYPRMHETYPWNTESEVYATGHEIGFTNVKSWLNFLQTRDFSFGTRIHGNIAAVLAGIPTYIFAIDTRILELAKYHNIQHMLTLDVNKKTDIMKVYEQADFTSVLKGHKERFHHYLDFLECNGLQHVFGEERVNLETPFDRALNKLDFGTGIVPYTAVPTQERIARKQKFYYNLVMGKCIRVTNNIKRNSFPKKNAEIVSSDL